MIRARLVGTGRLASNGGALILNVLVSGLGGFVFWIVVARNASTQAVAEATALVSTMLGVLLLSQRPLTANLPPLIAAAPRPRRMAGRAYAASTVITGLAALAYIAIGPQVADGLAFLRDGNLAAIFLFGCLIWSFFSIQDAILTGLRKGELVLAENTVWGLARLALIVLIPLIGWQLDVELILGTWLLPALVMVGVVNYYLFVRSEAPLRQPLGDQRFDRRWLFTHLGFEQLSAVLAGTTRIVVPAVVLTTLGPDDAAPFMAALSIVLVSESAMASFTSAFAVEMRRAGGASRELVRLTLGFLTVFSLATVIGAQLLAEPFMGLFGDEYRESGGTVLAILALGVPARCSSMLASAVNRVYGAGWRTFLQGVTYTGTLFVALFVVSIDSGSTIAWCIVIGRYAAGLVGVWQLGMYLHRKLPVPGVAAAAEHGTVGGGVDPLAGDASATSPSA